MNPSYSHPSLRRLEKLEPVNARPLHERLYHEVLIAGQDYTPDTAEDYRDAQHLLGEVLMAWQEFHDARGPFADMFGAYMEGSFQTNMHTGQFFTPECVCQMMAAINVTDDTFDHTCTYSDPCSGTGRFMLAIAEQYAARNHGVMDFMVINADLDFRAFVYCCMNAWLSGIPAVTIWGDSLSMEAYDAFATFRGLGEPPHILRMPKEAAQDLMRSPFAQEAKTPTLVKTEQADLRQFFGGAEA